MTLLGDQKIPYLIVEITNVAGYCWLEWSGWMERLCGREVGVVMGRLIMRERGLCFVTLLQPMRMQCSKRIALISLLRFSRARHGTSYHHLVHVSLLCNML